MRPKRRKPRRRGSALTALSALVLLADDGCAFAQGSNTSRELPPIEVGGGETTTRKKPVASRRVGKPSPNGHRNLVNPAGTQASDARSVASGAKGQPGMASETAPTE